MGTRPTQALDFLTASLGKGLKNFEIVIELPRPGPTLLVAYNPLEVSSTVPREKLLKLSRHMINHSLPALAPVDLAARLLLVF